MADYGERSGPRLTLATILLAAGLPLGVLVVVAFARVAVADYAIHQQKDVLERDIVALSQENDRLRARVAYVNSDTGIELLAREELGWVRPGDTAVVVVSDPIVSPPSIAGVLTPTVSPTAR